MRSERQKKIVVIDDEAGMRHMLELVLKKAGYRVETVASAEAALLRLKAAPVDIVLSDIRMPGMDGLTFLDELRRLSIDVTVIMMSAYGSIDVAIECMKQGAYDYISKPFKPDEVVLTLRKAEERLALLQENTQLKQQLEGDESRLLAQSSAMKVLLSQVDQLADSLASVLIQGETGTGKELIARALHRQGCRRKAPFVAVNCSAIPAALMESELFGHARGAFTGADRARPGLFMAAKGGTLFLDEIGELPLELQAKLLRVLQEGEIRPVGETAPRKVDVRVVSATAQDLKARAGDNLFRTDLFYRLAVVELHVPPLRERVDDIGLLADYFVEKIACREGRNTPVLSECAREALEGYPWPGNVRELENFIERTMIFSSGPILDFTAVDPERRRVERNEPGDLSLKQAAQRLEREYIGKALQQTGGNRTHAAKVLEISLRSLLYKIKAYELE
ncbi:MAG: hypothetical protein C0618_03950 [Desulfuromonas sp.]|nr:MAG: hypothetical protein C0618_03950 [Desulfuromonas sp.]